MNKENLKWLGAGLGCFILFLLVVKLLFERKVARYQNACEKAFGRLDQTQKDSIAQIIRAFDRYGDKDKNKLVYILATARHESNFRPIRERRAKPSQTEVYQDQNAYWYTGYYGRGFVQLTWKRNYAKMSRFLGIDLVGHPDLALNPKYAARILVYGMIQGSFTRKALGDYINAQEQDYYYARRSVNGTDRAALIQGYTFQIFENL
ncbi:glycoside hydrolase family 19 protein [Aureispira anguillae]|uniref:Glycoside hydrolase family 19 catalytic domain-containing protein n=1 Tax=Aureispira anguillae TaxID=2864201 RepID=A0A916DUQ1_9BACT|nr:glycoside hydrolase family 19 protein [Aureispira anguillae]BDS12730.1 hypothetical protein AsAng_0034550 [Aureispira anguillae]